MYSVCRRTGGNEFFFFQPIPAASGAHHSPAFYALLYRSSAACAAWRLYIHVYIGISSRLRSLFPYFHPRRYLIYNHVVPFSLTRFFLPLPPPPIYIYIYIYIICIHIILLSLSPSPSRTL